MTELSALHVAITGDSAGLSGAVKAANDQLTTFGKVTTAAESKMRGFDSALAKAGSELTGAQRLVNAFANVMDELGTSAARSAAQFADFAKMAATIDRLDASLNPLVAQSQRVASAFDDLDAALEAGVISQQRFASLASQLDSELRGLSNSLGQVSKSASMSAAAFEEFDRMARGVDNLRASFDPLFAASKRYEAAVEQLDAALEAGAISQAQYNRVLQQAETAYLGPTRAISGMGGVLGGLAQRLTGARGQIQNVSYQLADVAVQFQAGTGAAIIFAQQGSQIASAFGPMGAAIGAVLATLPLLALAFSSGAAEADKMSAAAEHQKEVLDNLTASTYALRLERQALQSGAFLSGEQEALNEITRLGYERVALEAQLTDELNKGNDAMGLVNQKNVEAIRLRLQENATAKAQLETIIESGRLETARIAAINLTKAAQDKVLQVMRQLAAADITSPWNAVVGAIQSAINKVNEYAQASFGMSTGSADWAKGQMGFTRPGEELLPPSPQAQGGLGGGGGGGGGGVNPIQAELEAMQQSLMTQEQLQMESYQRQQDVLAQALQQRLITQQQYAAMMEQVEATHGAAMQNQSRANASEVLGNLQTVFQGSKKIGAAIALANSYLAFTEVLKDPAYVGRPFARFAAAAAALSSGLQAVRSIKSASPGGGGGGSVGGATGGASTSQASASPLQVSLNTFGAGDFIRTADFGMILDRLNREAGDRGYTILSMPA